ncbi:hypothetical protein DPQ33_01625 [Oceanidesulfovibrio indonesiensis]|uniref:DUF6651 domain-containing protein n=1 Tax=Oceanidesulfovibrio indonesiensis TaxID=54767 RepID=A0A7M3MKK4_9BACT|nr:DUF6651 domain-containing protein [Oceanidesulfovibrio indonesiensis]TVM19951.1 hypothetical protein DPQ33_01625 [Oceanidesulfovibrio indonesiensis]
MDEKRMDPVAAMAGPSKDNVGEAARGDSSENGTPEEHAQEAALKALQDRVNALVAQNEELRERNRLLIARVEQPAAREKPADEPAKNDAAVARLQEQLARRDEQIRTLLVRNAVASSRFINEKTLLPPGVALDVFSRIFTVEEIDGELMPVAHLPSGEPIMSRVNPGKPAGPEEAIEIYVLNHFPERDAILKGGSGGSGAGGNQEYRTTPRAVPRNDARAFSRHLEAIAAGKVDVI